MNRPETIIHAFGLACKDHPDATAVIEGARRLTYHQLDERSRRAALELAALGVTPNDSVAVCLPRNLDLPVVLLAILKAGATYVPIDPDAPIARQQACLTLGDCRLLISELDSSLDIRQCTPCDLQRNAGPAHTALPEPNPDRLACLFFTSGSTGKPKAVEVTQSGILRTTFSPGYVSLTADTRLASLANPTFDALTFELFGALLNGGTLVMVPAADLREPERFADLLIDARIDTLFMTAALFHTLVDLRPDALAGLRDLLVGGEPVRPASVARFFKACPQRRCRLYNAYGPTECTTFALIQPIDADNIDAYLAEGRIPIGFPIDQTDIAVLDAERRPVKPGAAGELYLGGLGVARGYRHHPEATAKRFLTLPERGHTLWYATGDRVRLRPDGALDFLGREDGQVKIRGHRVELSAIEHCLAQHPAVSDVAVYTVDNNVSQRLEAWLVFHGKPVTAAMLRQHLAASLPGYMIPSRYHQVEYLPITATGKLDRCRLPQSPSTPLPTSDEPSASQHTLPHGLDAVLSLCRTLLNTPVGADDRFLEAGGDSLSAMAVVGQLAREHCLTGSVGALLSAPSLADFALTLMPVEIEPQTANPLAPYPASAEQARMVFLQQLSPASRAYNAHFVYRVDGSLNSTILVQALNHAVIRHPALITRFEQREEGLWAIPDADCQPSTAVFDTEEEAIAFCDAPFEMNQAPMLRSAVVESTGESHCLFLSFHHVAIDGQSVNLFLADLSRDYQALLEGESFAPLETGPGYADFAEARRRFLSSSAAQEQRMFWKKRLQTAREEGYGPLFSAQAQGADDLSGEVLTAETQANDWRHLVATARELEVTPFTLLLTLFGWSLTKVTGQTTLTVATPVANRGLGGFDRVCGLCVNTLPCFLSVDMHRSLEDQVRVVQAEVSRLFRHQDLDYDELVDFWAASGERDSLFDVMLVLENTRPDTLRLKGSRVHPRPFHNGSAKFPLTLFVTPSGKGSAHLALEYAPGHVSQAQAEAIMALMHTALGVICQSRETLLTALPVTGLPLESWEHRPGTPVEGLPLSWFSEQVRRTPEATAVRFRQHQLTYAELDRASNQLAGRLANAGIRPGDRVGLCLYRSLELLPALLGVWKAGAAYVPLDPDYPTQRLDYLIDDADIEYILTHEPTRERAQRSGQALELDIDELLNDEQVQHPNHATRAEQCAYVIYTSGSTGHPKGVMIAHGSLVHYLDHAVRHYASRTDYSVVSSSLNFDATITTLLTPLMAGGTVELLPQDRQEIPALADILNGDGPPRLFKITPTHLWALQDYLGDRPDPTPHLFVVGGEAFDADLARHYRRRFPKAEFVNEYGPTETVVGCMEYWLPCDLDDPAFPREVPIGQPIANTRLCILDPWGGPSPVGIEGELYIGGPGVGIGYHRREELTQARFRTLADGRRYYASGDYACWSQDGLIHYRGRRDDQLKIRGHRIETGEVESQLRALPGVRQAACATKRGAKGDTSLIGYVVPDDAELDLATLRERLKAVLPEAAVPDRILALDALPYTPNGKLDREALPEPEAGSIQPADANTRPETAALETLLIQEIESILGYAPDPDLNFFEAGMNSLLLMKLHARLTTERSLTLELVDFFSHPNVASLAGFLSDQMPSTTEAEESSRTPATSVDGIAIIGMAVNVPGADNLADFWAAVADGRSGIDRSGLGVATGRVPAVASMAHLFDFDPAFFGLSPADAEWMDPQQRHILMGAVHAFENAGLAPGAIESTVGVYVSSSENRYQQSLLRTGATEQADAFQLSLLNEKDFLSSRLAYHLDLTGPSLTIQSACSSSLAAIHLACQQLRDGDCDIALAGGVSADPELLDGYVYRPGRIFSRDGRCRAFGEGADGTVPGNGLGLVVLKPLARARADGDRIYAVIEGSALANDGRDKVSYTAPSVAGQARVIRKALVRAGVTPDRMGYLEAHGTGTELGDPIEVEALTRAFDQPQDHPPYCALASAKSQVGHLASAAGAVGVIRAALGVYHGIRPASLDVEATHPSIPFERTPFYVNRSVTAWSDEDRWAGVSSFGMGGTNAHLVLHNETSTRSPLRTQEKPCFLAFSARSPEALKHCVRQAEQRLLQGDVSLAALANLLWRTKSHYPHRYGIWALSAEDALMQLSQWPNQPNYEAAIPEPYRGWVHGVREPLPRDQTSAELPLDTLPYPFDLKPYRIEVVQRQAPTSQPERQDDPSHWLYSPVWQPLCRLPREVPPANTERWLLAGPSDWASALDARPLTLTEALVELDTLSDEVPLELILGLIGPEHRGLETPLAVLRPWLARRPRQPLYLTVLTQDAVDLSPVGATDLDAATLQGLVRVAPVEFPNLTVRWLDLPLEPGVREELPHLWAALGNQTGQFALRQGQLWRPEVVPLAVTAPEPEPSRENEVYLVIGGRGGIGRAMLDYLARRPGATLVSLGRGGQDSVWTDPVERVWKQARYFDLAGDLTDGADMARLADWLRMHLGRLDGIVHAAGQPGQGLISQLDESRLAIGLGAKQAGFANLEVHLLPLTPRWCLVMSSLSALVGVAGQTDYAAAHAYADAWTLRQAASRGRQTDFIAINWPTWRDTGMAAAKPALDEDDFERRFKLAREEALAVVEMALSLRLPRLIVSPLGIREVFDHFEARSRRAVEAPETAETDPVLQAFRQVLGLDEVAEDDDFQSLGGDSLTALDVLDRLDPLFPGRLDPGSLLDLGTPASIRAYLEAADEPEEEPTEPETDEQHTPLLMMREGESPCPVMIHPIGGDLTGYRPLVAALPTDQGVLGLRDPILAGAKPGYRSINELAARYVSALAGTEVPVLVGWSFGALVAWEMARQLEAAGRAPGALLLIDPPPPDGEPTADTRDEPGTVLSRELALLKPEWQGTTEVSQGQRYLQRLTLACDCNAAAMAAFRPQEPLRTPATLVVALQGERPDDVRDRSTWLHHAWQPHFQRPLRALAMAADHYSIMSGPTARELARLTEELLLNWTPMETSL